MLSWLPEDGTTDRSGTDTYTFLLKTEKARVVAAVRQELDAAGIPYRLGVLVGHPPQSVFTVPASRFDEAQDLLSESTIDLEAPARFPGGAMLAVGAVIALHFALVVWMIVQDSTAMLGRGGLLKGGMVDEPWRLLTALFLHVDPLHVFWNGASMMVFAVPLLTDLRYLRTGLIYLAAGLGGGITALSLADPGTVIVGSSGAVAGLFGAWVVLAWRRARTARMSWRAHVRTLGIALLVLPSLLSPINSRGNPVSVSSHVGGLATGMLIGATISSGLLRREERPDEGFGPM